VDSDPGTTKNLLDAASFEYLRAGGSEVELNAGETVLHKGDPGEAVYVVLEGELEVLLQAADGRRLQLCRLGYGEIFGELSVLRDAPVSADVTTLTPVRLLRYPADLFPKALAECEPLREQMISRLAHSLHRSTKDAWDLYKRERAFADLAGAEQEELTMIAASARMRAVKKKIEELGKCHDPVLVTGETGTGRTLTARLIHRASEGEERALIVVDCQELPVDRARAAVFGLCTGEPDFRDASGCFGALHLAHGGDLVLRNLGALAPPEQLELARYLAARRKGEGPEFPVTRVIATAHDLEDPHYAGEIVGVLREEFSEVVKLPKLSDRPRDIVPLARHFLEELDGAAKLKLSRSAEHALVSLSCPVRNVDELRDVVELAVHCCAGDEIRADHIFGGLGEDEVFGYALGQPPVVARFVGGPGLRLVRWGTLAAFVVAIVLCIAAGSTIAGRFANGFVWSVWEPTVFAIFLLGGALWCTVCPLSTAGRLAKNLIQRKRSPPSWIGGTASIVLPVAGFFAILWVEWVFHMKEVPVGSGILLSALILSSVLLCMLYEREVWCRHVCPLGRLAVVLAPAAPLSLAADRKLCASTCTTHECYRGAEDIPGCTVFHHPMNTSEAHHCKLCGDCLRSCPHTSTGLYLRPPLQGAWRLRPTGSYPSAFALTLLLLSPLFLAAQQGTALARPGVLTAAGIAAVICGLLIGWRLPHLLSKRGENVYAAPPVAAAFAVLAWGPLMAVQFGNIPILANLRLSAGEQASWIGRMLHGVALNTLADVTVILLAAAAAGIILLRTRTRCRRELHPIAPLAWQVLVGVWSLSLAISLYLVL
jgi:CRP-like cAMP-binding protein/polyferredoxin